LKQIDLLQLFKTPVLIPITIDQDIRLKLDVSHRLLLSKKLFLQLQLHQLDDYFYRMQKAKLQELTIFYLNWRTEELQRYQAHPDIVSQLEAWPDGSEKAPLNMGVLIAAGRTNADHAAKLMGQIFLYESHILDEHLSTDDKIQKQTALLQFSAFHEEGSYISFRNVLGWDMDTSADIKGEISELRNSCMHNVIPLNGSYRALCMPGSVLGHTLGIHSPLGKDRTEQNIYEVMIQNESQEEE